MVQKASKFREELADREAIRACIHQYCRAQDTQDEALLHDVYWPGAIDDHVHFRGPKEAFVEWCMPRLRAVDYIKHMITNTEISFESPSVAHVESYYQAISGITQADGRKTNIVSLGIYRDRFEKREDEWRIADRLVILTPPEPGSIAMQVGWAASNFAPEG
jgi:hypothetical protein